jgi:hypothetical protein
VSGEGVIAGSVASTSLPSLAKLRELVYGPIRDTGHNFVPEWFVKDMLNEGYLDLNARLRLNKNTTTGTSEADGEIPIPADAIEFENLWLGSTSATFVDDDTYLGFKNYAITPYDQLDITAQLARIHVGTGKIETYPAAVSTAYTLEYVARPTLMDGESDTPSVLTRELVPRIVNYARAHAYWQDGKEPEGARCMALYEQGLPGAPREAFRRRPYTMSLIPESGPYG